MSGCIIRCQPKLPAREPFRPRSADAECTTALFGIRVQHLGDELGSLSANAIRALNKGAKLGDFAHDSGEGGVSRVPPRTWRRSHLGGRLRLFLLPQQGRQFLP